MSAIITLTTHIAAPVERCFNLSLSVDLHSAGLRNTNEKAVAGVTSGVMKLGDFVTWQARHLGFNWNLTTRITKYQSPFYFVSEMEEGPFSKIHHQHIFRENGIHTIMTDIFEFSVPAGILGRFAERVFLIRYMRKLLECRNKTLRFAAQSDEWKKYLTSSNSAMEPVG